MDIPGVEGSVSMERHVRVITISTNFMIKSNPSSDHALLSVTFATESHWLSPHILVEWLS